MDQPSTAGLYDIVVGDDLRDVGVPILLFTAASLAVDTDPGPPDPGQPGPGPSDLSPADLSPAVDVARAAEESGVELAGLALFGTDGYRLQRALGQQLLDLP